LIPLVLSKRSNTDQYWSQEDLFDNMSDQGASQPTQTGPVPVQNTDFFNIPLKLKDARELHNIILTNHASFRASEYVDNIKYQGFERETFLKAALMKITANQLLRLAIIGAIRGANFKKIVESSSKVDADLVQLHTSGVLKRKAVGSAEITVLRCTASIPQWCAYFLGSAGVTKKIPTLECPPQLQFPAAGSLPMSKAVRLQHIRFCMHFSKLIKGEFNENIYITMMTNQIPSSEVPDELRLILGSPEPGMEAAPLIEDVKKEFSTAVMKSV